MRFAFAELAGGPGAEPRDIATATLSGNLTRDVELRTLPSGAEVAGLRVATTTWRRNGEQWADKTSYFTVDVYGAQARACAEHLAKGSRVLVDAELDWRDWNDAENRKRRRSPSGPAKSCSRALAVRRLAGNKAASVMAQRLTRGTRR
jgi:single stranded DNA-binding protein